MSLWAVAWLAVIPSTLRVYAGPRFTADFNSWMLGPLAIVQQELGWDIVATMFAALPLLLALLILLLCLLEGLAWLLRLDREDQAAASLAWSWHALPAAGLWMLVGTGLFFLASYIGEVVPGPSTYVILPFASALAWLCTLPFFALNRMELRRPRPRLLWRPAWPGAQALMLVILIFIACAGVQLGIDAASAALVGEPLQRWIVAVDIAWSCVLLLPLAAALYLWLNRTNAAGLRADWHRLYSRRALGALLVLQCRWFVVVLLVVVLPFAVLGTLMTYVVPQVEEWQRASGADPTMVARVLLRSARLLFDYGWIAYAVLPVGLLVAEGRLLVSLGLAGDEAD